MVSVSQVVPGRIYAGQTGATKWPSGRVGSATLASRIGSNHLRGRIRGSTFRFTLASALVSSLELTVVGAKKLSRESEQRLSMWMQRHLEVAVHPFANRDALASLEMMVLNALDPPLNLSGCTVTPLRSELSRHRLTLAGTVPSSTPSVETGRSQAPVRSTAHKKAAMSQSKVTLHEEIAAILREHGDWMSTQEIADAVNTRGNYSKKDGSAMTAFQIHGRTSKYDHLFEPDGGRVRLQRAEQLSRSCKTRPLANRTPTPRRPFHAWSLELHGHEVIYRTAGSGPPVVIVHGMVNSSKHWRDVALRLAETHTVSFPT